MSIPRPIINERTWVAFSDQLDPTFPSRVEYFENDEYSIAAPFERLNTGEKKPTPIELEALPADIYLAWRTEGGYASARAKVHSVEEGALTLWHMWVQPEVKVIQRREFVRAPDNAEADLVVGTEETTAQLVDLSEGGAACIVKRFEVLNPDAEPLTISLHVEDTNIRLAAELIRQDFVDLGKLIVALRFVNATDAEAEMIRRHVFGRQLLLRRTPDAD